MGFTSLLRGYRPSPKVFLLFSGRYSFYVTGQFALCNYILLNKVVLFFVCRFLCDNITESRASNLYNTEKRKRDNALNKI